MSLVDECQGCFRIARCQGRGSARRRRSRAIRTRPPGRSDHRYVGIPPATRPGDLNCAASSCLTALPCGRTSGPGRLSLPITMHPCPESRINLNRFVAPRYARSGGGPRDRGAGSAKGRPGIPVNALVPMNARMARRARRRDRVRIHDFLPVAEMEYRAATAPGDGATVAFGTGHCQG